MFGSFRRYFISDPVIACMVHVPASVDPLASSLPTDWPAASISSGLARRQPAPSSEHQRVQANHAAGTASTRGEER
jgi:hypothetical protein